MPIPKQERAEKLVARLMKLSQDQGLRYHARHILNRMRFPMDKVLAKVPGDSVVAKAAAIGISRQSYYSWLRGASRPNKKQSKKLEQLTGVKWQDIFVGYKSSPPPSSTP